MRYRQRRRLYSQNFLRSPKLIRKLVRKSSIGKNDIVLEIGPGKGFITSELIKNTKKVVCIELDRKLCLHLQNYFQEVNNLEISNCNFLDFKLPNYSYKVFSNIPFNITADIVHKLTSDDNFLEAYLIVQREAAKRFIGKPYDVKNSMVSILLKPWFEISVFWRFRRYDFMPHPNVNVVMIKIKRKDTPLVPWTRSRNYRDFILHSYNRNRNISRMSFEEILNLYKVYEQRTNLDCKKLIALKAQNILFEQKHLKKIHRTRTDRSWRRFR